MAMSSEAFGGNAAFWRTGSRSSNWRISTIDASAEAVQQRCAHPAQHSEQGEQRDERQDNALAKGQSHGWERPA